MRDARKAPSAKYLVQFRLGKGAGAKKDGPPLKKDGPMPPPPPPGMKDLD